jgi:hypothetical protein
MTINLDILAFPVLVILCCYNFFIFNIEKKISYVKACTKKGQLIENKIKKYLSNTREKQSRFNNCGSMALFGMSNIYGKNPALLIK